jgi:hypothetical protein
MPTLTHFRGPSSPMAMDFVSIRDRLGIQDSKTTFYMELSPTSITLQLSFSKPNLVNLATYSASGLISSICSRGIR